MTGPDLSPREVQRILRRKVKAWENMGVPRRAAIEAAARSLDVPVEKVSKLVGPR